MAAKRAQNVAQMMPQVRFPMERMLRIHEAIQSRTYPNATDLAKRFEVSQKSIQRDLVFMRDRLQLPIAYDGARWGYYYTKEVKAFPSLQISEGELFALLVAEKALQQYRGTPFERPLLSAFRKMAAALPDTISLNLADWDQTISFRTSAEPLMNLATFDCLAKATASHRRLELIYRKPGQAKPEKRIIDPYHLANINGEWFLFAFDHLRNAIRTFSVVRIKSARVTDERFERPEKFSVQKTLQDSFGVLSGRGEYDVIVRFKNQAADYIREKRWHSSQRIRDLPRGELELRMRLSSLGEVERWILSWGGNAIPIAPAELVESVRNAASELAANCRRKGKRGKSSKIGRV